MYKAKLLKSGSRIILISSESGSITLRHEKGGGHYGHHARKSASNMVAKLLALDLKEAGVIDEVDHSKSGEYWAPKGPRDIGTAEAVLEKDLSTPLKLPW